MKEELSAFGYKFKQQYLSRKYLLHLIFTKINGDFTLGSKIFVPILKIMFQINYNE